MLCLARAYGDEPLKRVVVGAGPRLLYVANPDVASVDSDAGVGFPVESIFAFDATLYDRLRAAFDSADKQSLWALWQSASPLAAELVDA